MKSNKTIGLIIPTRWDSERLPGKALIDINGKPNLERIIERAGYSKYLNKIILAVSDKEGNKPIEDWFWKYDPQLENKKIRLGLQYGPHNNIFQRTLNVAQENEIDIIVDISHCCSLFDPFLADVLIDNLFLYEADYSTNVLPRSFPDGFDIQVYTREIYEKTFIESSHKNAMWTGWNIWHCREDLNPKPRITNMHAIPEYYFPEWRFTLDTPEDLKVISEIYKHFQFKPDFGFDDVIEFLLTRPDLLELNKSIIPTKLEAEPC